MQHLYLKQTINAIDKSVQARDKFLVLKFHERRDLEELIYDNKIDFIISDPDFFAQLAFEERAKAIAMLWHPQAKSAGYSSAATIVVSSNNDKSCRFGFI